MHPKVAEWCLSHYPYANYAGAVVPLGWCVGPPFGVIGLRVPRDGPAVMFQPLGTHLVRAVFPGVLLEQLCPF